MVERGLGYSILAELILQKTSYEVEVCPIKEKIVRIMALVTKDKREISVAAKTFMRFVLKNVK